MVYYAFVRRPNLADGWRYLLEAPNAGTIDEWWRAVSETRSGYQRLAPDFYTFDEDRPFIPSQFQGSIIVGLLNDFGGRIFSLFPNQDRTDLVSGRTYYVRSKSDPRVFWYEKNKEVFASAKGRSRFRVRIEGTDTSKVMIAKDALKISSAKDEDLYIYTANNGELRFSGHGTRYTLDDLKGNFLAEGLTSTDERESPAPVLKAEGAGEEWELVA